MKQDRDVTVCLKLALTIRVQAETDDEADEEANDRVTEMLEGVVEREGFVEFLKGCRVAEELDRATHRVRVVPIQVRTVAVPRDIGDGVIADDWADQ